MKSSKLTGIYAGIYTGLYKDYVVSNLRSQLTTLRSVLENVENMEIIDEGYFAASLKRVEQNLRVLRGNV